MNLLLLLVPMCASTLAFFLVPPLAVAANPEPESTASASASLRRRLSRSFAPMEAQSPGMSAIRVVHHQDLNRKILIALIVASTLLVGILLFLLFFWICRQRSWKNPNGKRKNHNINPSTKGRLQNPIKDRFNSIRIAGKRGSVGVIEYQLLEAATNNFAESNVLGEGGRGKVYRACLDKKVLAAVKRLDGDGAEIQREFENEVNWLIRIRHQNIVSLLGYCTHDQTRLLVYEMMQNGSLETLLHGSTEGSTLTWQLRLKIVIDIARALEYLHEHCNPPVVHRDIKSSNILLDSNFNAKLSDFGLAVTAGNENNNLKLSGTLGYVAPEYLLEGKLTDKSDVYSFGVVLLELLMGKKPLEKMSPSRCQSLVTWAMPQLIDRTKLPNIVDPVIRNTMDLKHLYQVAAVAVLCIQPEPSYRPLITDVLHSLIPLLPTELGGSLRMS